MLKRTKYFFLIFLVILLLYSLFDFSGFFQFFSTGNVLFDKLLDVSQLKTIFSSEIIFFPLIYILIAIIIDVLLSGWKNSSLHKVFVSEDNSVVLDLISYIFVTTGLFAVFQFVFSIGLAYFLAGLFFKNFHLNILGHFNEPYTQSAMMFILIDLKQWFGHWLLHKPRLWHFHAFHHSATEFTLFTNARGHFFEEVIYSMITGIFIALIGLPLINLFYFFAFKSLYGLIIHSDIKHNFGWIGRWVLITPNDHKLHHSIAKEDYGKNFGTLFKWWDLIFKTYKSKPGEEIKIGIQNNPYNTNGYLFAHWIGFRNWMGTLKSGKIN